MTELEQMLAMFRRVPIGHEVITEEDGQQLVDARTRRQVTVVKFHDPEHHFLFDADGMLMSDGPG
jgi:hypothetical protein